MLDNPSLLDARGVMTWLTLANKIVVQHNIHPRKSPTPLVDHLGHFIG